MPPDTPPFERDAVGRWSAPQPFVVTADGIAAYAAATNDPHPSHRDGVLAPPVFPVVPAFAVMPAALAAVVPAALMPRILHGEHAFEYHEPLVPGTTILSRAAVTGFATRAAGAVVAVGVRSTDAATERLLVEQTATMVFRGADAQGEAGTLPTLDRAPAPAPSEVRHETTQRTDADQTHRYAKAAGDPMPIHLDDEAARRVGLPGIIVHGMCTMAFVSQPIVATAASGDPRRLRRLAVRFADVLRPQQPFTTSLWRTSDTESAATYRFETAGPSSLVLKGGLAAVDRR